MMRSIGRGWMHPAALRRAVAALSVVLAWVLVGGIAHAGAKFFYCHAMDELRDDCCCPPAPGERAAAAPQATLAGADCCSPRTLARLPKARTAGERTPLSAPLARVLPARELGAMASVPRPPPLGALCAARAASSQAPPLFASERHTRLMVFLS